jgi:hypothetical protein
LVLRWLLLVPFACLVAMGAGLFALGVASVASPAVAIMIGGGVERLLDLLFGLADNGIDPAPAAQAAFGLVTRLGWRRSSRSRCSGCRGPRARPSSRSFPGFSWSASSAASSTG